MLLEVKEISKSYEKNKVLNNINFSVKGNEFVAIMGTSGSGKTTLLNCISTIDLPTSGSVFFGGKNLGIISNREMAEFRRENMGFVFQNYNLLDTLTVRENIILALAINKVPSSQIQKKIN